VKRTQDATECVLIVANKLISNKLKGGEAKALEVINGYMEQLRQETYTMDMLFAALGENPEKIRKQGDQVIGEHVLRVVEYFAKYGRFTKSQRKRLESAAGSLATQSVGATPLPGILPDMTEESA
jgi:hypothetical protein